MALDKVLNKIQLQIDELTPLLELFVDASIQPSVEDCEKLQQNLYKVQENLAIYKHQKLNKELSPSFNLHAKVSEKENLDEAGKFSAEQKKPAAKLNTENSSSTLEKAALEIKKETPKTNSHLTVGINDKFRFINELFAQNASEYNIAMEQLVNLNTWPETEVYMSSLKSLYTWKDNSEVVKYFYALVKKRFD